MSIVIIKKKKKLTINKTKKKKNFYFYFFFQAKSGKELVGFLFNDFFLLAQPYKTLQHNQIFSIDSTLNISFKIYKKVV